MGKPVRGPFVKMVVPCSRLISQPFLTSWAGRRDDVAAAVHYISARHYVKAKVSSLTKWLLCVFLNSISQPALMSDGHRLQLFGSGRHCKHDKHHKEPAKWLCFMRFTYISQPALLTSLVRNSHLEDLRQLQDYNLSLSTFLRFTCTLFFCLCRVYYVLFQLLSVTYFYLYGTCF